MDKSDASGALRWADALPTDASRASAYGNVATAWFVHDSKAASQWVNGLPPGPDRDAAAASIASNSTRYDEPEGAFAWAASVQDPALRARATGDVIGIWARYDPQMTSEAVAASALPESEKAALLRILNQNR